MLKHEFVALMRQKMNENKAAREAKAGTNPTGDYTLTQVEDALSGFINAALEVMRNGDSIALPGFGKYSTVYRKERTGKVPGSDKTYVSPPRYVPRFTFSEVAIKSITEANASRI